MRTRFSPGLALTSAAILLIAACCVFASLGSTFREQRWSEEGRTLRSEVLLLEEILTPQFDSTEPAERQTHVQRLGSATGIRITLISDDGTVLADSEANPAVMDNHGTRAEVLAALDHDFGTTRRLSKTLGAELIYVARAIRRDGALLGWIRASVRSSELSLTMTLDQWILGALGVILAGGALVSTTLAVVGRKRGAPAA